MPARALVFLRPLARRFPLRAAPKEGVESAGSRIGIHLPVPFFHPRQFIRGEIFNRHLNFSARIHA